MILLLSKVLLVDSRGSPGSAVDSRSDATESHRSILYTSTLDLSQRSRHVYPVLQRRTGAPHGRSGRAGHGLATAKMMNEAQPRVAWFELLSVTGLVLRQTWLVR